MFIMLSQNYQHTYCCYATTTLVVDVVQLLQSWSLHELVDDKKGIIYVVQLETTTLLLFNHVFVVQ